MTRVSLAARQDAALVAFLDTLPEDRLAAILHGLGIDAERQEARARKQDNRRCNICGNGYVRCRAIAEKTGDDHEWSARA